MTEQTIDIPTLTATQEFVRFLKLREREDRTRQWELVDKAKGAVDEHMPDGAVGHPSVKTGLYDAIREVWEAAIDEGVHDIQIETVARWHNVASAWPEEDRVEGASFSAHRKLAAKEWDGKRKRILEKLARRSNDGYVSEKDVINWKDAQRPSDMTPWAVRFEKRVRSPLASRVAAPVTEGDWKAAHEIYRRVLREIEEKLAEF